MDRSWILRDDRVGREFLDGIRSFVTTARNHLNEKNECLCPYRRCANRYFATLRGVRVHIMRYGFSISYDVWVCHGEQQDATSSFLAGNTKTTLVDETINLAETYDSDDDGVMMALCEDLTRGGVEKNGPEQPFMSSNQNSFIGEDAEKLYPGCKFSILEVVIRMLHMKVMNRWTDKSFDQMLNFIKLVWPDLKRFPSSTYDAKKRLRDVGLMYEKIDVCKNDCMLFWKEHAKDYHCHVCGDSRYKLIDGNGKKIPYKSLRYFRIGPRLQRLFGSRHTAADMR